MNFSLPPTLSFKSFAYSFFALYALGMAVCWDYNITQPKKQPKTCCTAQHTCCSKSEACKAKKSPSPSKKQKEQKSPPSCPCNGTQNMPTQLIFWHEHSTAYQLKKGENKKFVHKLFEKELASNYKFSTASVLPDAPLPIATGKERLRRIHHWRI